MGRPMKPGERAAVLFFLLLKGQSGPFGGEDPMISGSTVTLESQMGQFYYTFHDDGSVKVTWDDMAQRELDEMWEDDEYESPTFLEYGSIHEMLQQDESGWLDDIDENLTVGELLNSFFEED